MQRKNNNYTLKADERFQNVSIRVWPIKLRCKFIGKSIRKILEFRRKKLLFYQEKQQLEVEDFFLKRNIKVNSYYRKPDGTWSINLDENLKKSAGKKRIIFLHASIIQPVDIVGTFPNWLSAVWICWLRAIEILKSKTLHYVEDVICDYWTVSGYLIYTTLQIKNELFWWHIVDVHVVKNAVKEDLQSVLNNADENTVLVVSGHGSYDGILLTDQFIRNEDVQEPPTKLKAFIQHTCGWWHMENAIGENWANLVYGYEEPTIPIDFLLRPLRKKNII